MGGSVGGGATGGTWSGGAGTWTNANNPSTATYTAGASETGSITLTLTTSGGSCGTTTATKTITVNANPTASAGAALAAINQGATSAAMGGSVGGGATGGTWSGGAGTWTNANNPSTATYTAGASETGSITLTLTTSGGSCGTTTATKTITVNSVCPSTIPGNTTCVGATISTTPCSSVTGATIDDNITTTLGIEYDWTGATTSGMSNTSTNQALVEIGCQCWMRYNMNVTPSNFNPVPTWVNNTDVGWSGIYTGGPFSNEGLLYQWKAAMNNSTTERAQGVCPSGWHIPSDCEWMYLENSLGMSTADQQLTGLRASGDVDYDLSSAVSGGTNNSGFSGLLAGYRNAVGAYENRTSHGYWWSSSATGATTASRRLLYTGNRGVNRNSNDKVNGFSVRCLKD
jgi:uncharacterized protein (TIGR02145 family)